MSESPSYCAITVPLAKAPCLMKKPMNYQSWLRSLDFTPNKAWNDSTMLRLYFEKEEFEEAKVSGKMTNHCYSTHSHLINIIHTD